MAIFDYVEYSLCFKKKNSSKKINKTNQNKNKQKKINKRNKIHLIKQKKNQNKNKTEQIAKISNKQRETRILAHSLII